MSFQSLSFLAFLAVTAALCVTVGQRNRQMGKWLLLMAGLLFCAQAPAGGIGVLALSAAATNITAHRLPKSDARTRRQIAAVMAVWLVGELMLFKYAHFLTGGWAAQWAVPVGLSFFTFQQLWYLKNVYDGAVAPAEWTDFWLYTFFFPTVTSGPILKPQAFFPQLEEEKFLHPSWQDISAGLYAIAIGMGKKVLLADSFGAVVNNGWGRLADLSAPAAWLVILGYTFQLYFDFSGYCDIAVGAARLLGLRLPQNFNSPYRSCSVGEFWKRWHITLTTFLRECVYFPLGGSRKGASRAYLNILAVFLISGFWHGAGWTFLVWGALHGLAQIIERAWGPGRERLPGWLRWGVTFAFVNLAWVFFRAPDLAGAMELLRQAVTGGLARPENWLLSGLFSKETGAIQLLLPNMSAYTDVIRVLVLYGVGALASLWPHNTYERMDVFRPTLWRGALLVVLMGWSVLSFTGITTFIYSNF